MTQNDIDVSIDLRRGFGRAGTTLFWSSAAVVVALWLAQRYGLIGLGAWLSPLAFVILFIGFTASSLARMVGMTLYLATRSSLATQGATAISRNVASLSWLPRTILGLLPGASLLTIADLIAATREGRFAEEMRSAYQILAVVLGGTVMGVGAAAAGWQWWQGAGLAAIQGWLVVAAIGAGLMALLFFAAGWVADGFRASSRAPGS